MYKRQKKKFEVGRQIQFAGYLVGDNGIKPDPERIRAIRDFPQPTTLTGVRSFLGLAQQLSFFIPDFSHATAAIRQLLCQERRPRQPTNPRVTDPPSSAFGAPMAHVGLDLFDFAGKKHLICVDKWSGYPLYKRLNSTTTQSIINVLETWFNTLGWPSNIRSDGGPQFLGPFRQWCQKNNIIHELAAPYNPKSNGLAEACLLYTSPSPRD